MVNFEILKTVKKNHVNCWNAQDCIRKNYGQCRKNSSLLERMIVNVGILKTVRMNHGCASWNIQGCKKNHGKCWNIQEKTNHDKCWKTQDC